MRNIVVDLIKLNSDGGRSPVDAARLRSSVSDKVKLWNPLLVAIYYGH